jgi:hypothetical protein
MAMEPDRSYFWRYAALVREAINSWPIPPEAETPASV